MILIFSPQNWGHQFISKHHYAVAFSKKHKTIFFEPTTCTLGKYEIKTFQPFAENDNLKVVKITLPFPDIIRFKANAFFKTINAAAIKKWLKQQTRPAEILIDFGCHKAIKDWKFIDCHKKVYFPVDNYENLPIEKRGCNAFYTVSTNIQEKFKAACIPMKFMHHGLNHWFAEKAEKRLEEIENGTFNHKSELVNIAYSGNLTIPFLDRELILQLVSTYQDCQFHFFGNNESNDPAYNEWLHQLKNHANVHLYGQLAVSELAKQLFEMDAMLLCYKPDNRNYHAENSHKINEYLSTGMPLLTTSISVLKDQDLYYQLEASNRELNKNAFQDAKEEIVENSRNKMTKRIEYALKFRYEVLINELLGFN
ncbi:hypothetical protein [Phaeodactylibacter xiamenensis]|uniref:hypothetical protein n=1 Tax=Phaeodactylibacter xiamenensis TaxID=1524460 RepID=UPI0024A8329C|nr:hypothetical protein [Phaeodactylibacter xiamenensis]